MLISVHSRGIPVAESLRSWIEERMSHAAEHLENRVRSLEVFLSDENGPEKGGADKACRVVVHLAHQPALVVADRDSNLPRMIDRIADRLNEAIDRRAKRMLGRHRHSG